MTRSMWQIEKKHQQEVSHGIQNNALLLWLKQQLSWNKRARTPKERFYARRPLYPPKVLSKPYPERYEPKAFAQYDGRKGSAVEHMSKFIDTLGPYAANEDICLREFSNSLCNRAYTWYIGLKPGSIPTWDDMVDVFCTKYFHGEETVTPGNSASDQAKEW